MGKLKWHIILALWLALCGMASAEQLYVNESGWWRDDGVFNASGAPIQVAVDNAAGGDSIYVWNGSYYENVDVSKRLTLEGEGADVVTVTAAWAYDHVFEVTTDWVNISGFAVRGATGYTGIYLYNADHCNISGNNVSGNSRGIRMHSSSKNTLQYNTISGNMRNFGVSGDSLSHYTQCIDTSNTVDGKPIYYWVDQQDMVIPRDAGFVGVVNSTNITVRDLTLTKNSEGVLFAYAKNSRIENVTADSNEWGIYLIYSSNNIIANSTANSNWYGIFLMSSSNYNTLTNNEANLNVQIGIHLLYSCNHNIIENNIVSSNDDRGIDLSGENNYNILTNNVANSSFRGIHMGSSNYNTLTENNVSLNSGYGVDMEGSDNNTLTENTIKSNGWGISLWCSDNNTITCNMIQNNEYYGFYCYIEAICNNISYNNIIANGDYNGTSDGWEWQFHNGQSTSPVEAKHNYWGAGMNNSTIDASIYDEEWWSGKVEFYPFETDPVPCAPTPGLLSFTTVDAVIALQIAVGSREYDPRWDVSGDGRVTSLDVLMILQAAAGAINL